MRRRRSRTTSSTVWCVASRKKLAEEESEEAVRSRPNAGPNASIVPRRLLMYNWQPLWPLPALLAWWKVDIRRNMQRELSIRL